MLGLRITSRIIKFGLLLVLAGTNLIQAQNTSVGGFITDEESGEALIGANVYLSGTDIGTTTDLNGYYVVSSVPAGENKLVISYLGYETQVIDFSITAGTALKVDRELALRPLNLQEVVVTGENITRKYNIEPSKVKISPVQIRSLPAVVEPDLFRTIQSMPGVLTQSEFSTGLVIRGGNTDQNLILLDGITVYNPSHLGGVFSNFMVDAVKDAELIKGGFNAEYGGRLSAVLDIISREGNRNEFKAKANVSLLAAQITAEGPSYNGAWLLAARRTYFDQLLKNTSFYVPYYFYDLQGHIFSDLSSRDRISFSFYRGLDDLVYGDLGLNAEWGNNTLSMQYRRLFNSRLIGNLVFAQSRFKTYFNLGGESGASSDNQIDDGTAAVKFSFFQSQDLTWEFGGQFKKLSFSYLNTFGDTSTYNIDESPHEAAAFIKMKYVAGLRFIIEPGLRFNYYNNHSKKMYPEPRLGVKYILDENQFLNFAVGLYHQFIETVQDDFNPSILDNWFAVDESVKPASAVQWVLGYDNYFADGWKFQTEVYYKDISNMLTFEDTRSSADGESPSDKLSDTFIQSDGYAYGFETFLQKSSGNLTGWLAYTMSVSRKSMDGVEYYTNWDRTHAFNIIGSWKFRPKWELNGKWTWQSGQAYTPILGYFSEDLPGDPEPRFRTIPGNRNSGRYPAYHRLDMSLIRKFKFKRFNMDVSLQVINAYKRENIFRYVYTLGSTYNGRDDDGDWVEEDHDTNGNGYPDFGEENVDEADEGRIQRNDISIFPLIPSIGISLEL